MDGALSTELASLRARLIALTGAHGRGELDDDAYEAQRRDLERSLARAVVDAPASVPSSASPPATTRARPSMRLVAALVGVIALVAVGGYAFTGSPSLVGIGAPQSPTQTQAQTQAKADAPAPNEREIGLQQIAEMVDKLAVRLKDKPDDAEGWTMLARSYTVLTRYRDALPAFQHAIALQPTNANLIADYSDVLAAANGGKPTAESLAMIDRALKIDPAQPKALALAGTVAFDRGDFATAVAQWQKIADRLPPDGEFHQQVVANIDEARRRGNLPAAARSASSPIAAAASPTASPTAPTTAPTTASLAATPGREALTGTVSLAPALASRVSPTDTVFVLARPEGARMPLAVQRATVADLPLRFKLDDTMAMTPTAKLSTTPQVIVAARISKSGNAISQSGDLAGETGPVVPGTSGLVIEIAKEVGPR